MGMYTALHFNSALRNDAPKEVIEVLKYMMRDIIRQPDELPKHPLFDTERWRMLFTCDSYYFDMQTQSILSWEEANEHYYLCVNSNLKNYHNEIGRFLEWIMPYCDKYNGEFMGYYMYEEDSSPTLIYYAKEI